MGLVVSYSFLSFGCFGYSTKDLSTLLILFWAYFVDVKDNARDSSLLWLILRGGKELNYSRVTDDIITFVGCIGSGIGW